MTWQVSNLRWLAMCWLLLVFVVVFLAFRQGAVFDSSIISLLPESEQQPLVQQATEQMAERFSKRLILLLSAANEEKVRLAIKSLADSLIATPDVSSVVWRVEDGEISRIRDELYPYRFSIIEQGVRDLLLAENYLQIKERALFQLYSPLSVGGGGIIEDPFGLFSELTLNRKSDLNIQISNALLKVTETEFPTYMLMVTLAREPYSSGLQRSVLGTIEAQKSTLSQSGISINMSGMLMHAAAGARQARTEISTIGIGSLMGIVIAMLLIFRQFKPLLLMLFSITIGCVSAAAVTMLVFDRVHLITFAFGAGLVGVSIDYALHFLCESRVTSSEQILRKILPGLLLGLFSSVMAYSAQALTPFPGLQQMATFSVVGLTASWLTVVLWFPLLTRGNVRQSLPAADQLDKIRKRFPRVEGNQALKLLLIIAFILSAKSIWYSNSQDDIRLLQTSPKSLLAQEQRVQQALGVSSSSQFLLVAADTLEQCLQKEERLAAELESLKKDGLLKGYQALSLLLPSLNRQAENREMVRQLYGQQLKPFYDTLNVSENELSIARHNFEQKSEILLTSDVWLQQQSSQNWSDLIVMQTDTSVATVIRFTGVLDDNVKQRLMSISETEAGVSYVDKIQDISELMGNYRTQIVKWIVMAYICVLIVLLYRYKQQVWRVIVPPLLASVFTLAILLQFEQGLNLFHLMALILVLGIGLDMGIFLMETDQAPYTWLAVSLSTYTSLLAFGMLAWSDTPVLHHFGLTVLLGLAFVWLITPLMRKNNLGNASL
ncbi:MAG: MMPL family transporter [Gammaproteobacteria bacterium]|nr:MMPL family transporter [Gammaproteobacteria bacterium]